MPPFPPLDDASASLLRELIRNAKALRLAIQGYSQSASRDHRDEVNDMYQETSSAARTLLLSVLGTLRPGKSKGLGEVDRRFECCVVACRDLLSAVLSFLRR